MNMHHSSYLQASRTACNIILNLSAELPSTISASTNPPRVAPQISFCLHAPSTVASNPHNCLKSKFGQPSGCDFTQANFFLVFHFLHSPTVCQCFPTCTPQRHPENFCAFLFTEWATCSCRVVLAFHWLPEPVFIKPTGIRLPYNMPSS